MPASIRLCRHFLARVARSIDPPRWFEGRARKANRSCDRFCIMRFWMNVCTVASFSSLRRSDGGDQARRTGNPSTFRKENDITLIKSTDIRSTEGVVINCSSRVSEETPRIENEHENPTDAELMSLQSADGRETFPRKRRRERGEGRERERERREEARGARWDSKRSIEFHGRVPSARRGEIMRSYGLGH